MALLESKLSVRSESEAAEFCCSVGHVTDGQECWSDVACYWLKFGDVTDALAIAKVI